jgi:hypothetical protein
VYYVYTVVEQSGQNRNRGQNTGGQASIGSKLRMEKPLSTRVRELLLSFSRAALDRGIEAVCSSLGTMSLEMGRAREYGSTVSVTVSCITQPIIQPIQPSHDPTVLVDVTLITVFAVKSSRSAGSLGTRVSARVSTRRMGGHLVCFNKQSHNTYITLHKHAIQHT